MPDWSSIRRSVKHWPIIDTVRRLRYRAVYGRMPLSINLELTTRCNARCRMCPHPDSDFPKRTIDAESLERILDGIADAVRPGTILYPVGLGEPLLIADLPAMAARMAGRFPRARIHFNTNGILLGHARAAAFLDHAHEIVVSLNSPDAASYRDLMRVDKFAEVTQALRDFLARRAEHPRYRERGFPRVVVQMMGLRGYADRFASFRAEWAPRLGAGDAVHFNPMDNWGGAIAAEGLYSPRRGRPYPCQSPWRMVSIDVDGRVFPCCVPFGTRDGSSLLLGDVRRTPLVDMLRGRRLRAIREMHLAGRAGELSDCRNCDVYAAYPNIRFRIPFSRRWV